MARGLFPMRKHRKKEYNIFERDDGKFEGKIFDHYRRIYCITPPYDDIEKAIKIAKINCELYAKGQCIIGELVDEGKPIREREEREYLAFKKEMRKINRGVANGIR